MADVVDPATRSRMMAGIRNKDTVPELAIRRGLHELGFRYRLHDKRLPGKPDLLLPRYSCAIFVHGCFWHGHDCAAFKWPRTRPDFWRTKIDKNRENDVRNVAALRDAGWRICVVWECALRNGGADVAVRRIADWLIGSSRRLEIRA